MKNGEAMTSQPPVRAVNPRPYSQTEQIAIKHHLVYGGTDGGPDVPQRDAIHAINAAFERAAQECEQEAGAYRASAETCHACGNYAGWRNDTVGAAGSDRCAERIRALMSPRPSPAASPQEGA